MQRNIDIYINRNQTLQEGVNDLLEKISQIDYEIAIRKESITNSYRKVEAAQND